MLPFGGRLVVVLGVLELVFALVPASAALLTGVLVDRLGEAVAEGGRGAWGRLWVPALAIAALLVVDQLLQTVVGPCNDAVVRRINGTVRTRVRRAAMAPWGIAHLEDQSFRDDATMASDQIQGGGTLGAISSIGTGAMGVWRLIFRYVGGLAAAAVVARYSLWLAVVMVAAAHTTRVSATAFAAAGPGGGDLQTREAVLRRRSMYWTDLAAGAEAAKEVRVFGLGRWVVQRQHRAALDFLEPRWAQIAYMMRFRAFGTVLAFVSACAAFVSLTHSALTGGLGLGRLAATLSAMAAVHGLGSVGQEGVNVQQGKVHLAAFHRVMDRQAEAVLSPWPGASVPRRCPAIRFDNVSFSYPGTDYPVLAGFSLDVPAGETLALVGLNGAGKTTLVKLLAGLYQPTEGRILVDGVDLAEVDLSAWRADLAVIFQDFVHYHLSARDNVGLGAPAHLEDLAGLQAAARDAGALELIEGLQAGWDSVLSRAYRGGVDLSGGEWQRVALARALFAVGHGASVLVLDEPTANLDVRVELEVFDELAAAARDLTTILVSHRFSTVRRADRIAVLSAGRLLEEGTHEQLLETGGEYARMFQLQASRFGDSEVAEAASAAEEPA